MTIKFLLTLLQILLLLLYQRELLYQLLQLSRL